MCVCCQGHQAGGHGQRKTGCDFRRRGRQTSPLCKANTYERDIQASDLGGPSAQALKSALKHSKQPAARGTASLSSEQDQFWHWLAALATSNEAACVICFRSDNLPVSGHPGRDMGNSFSFPEGTTNRQEHSLIFPCPFGNRILSPWRKWI